MVGPKRSSTRKPVVQMTDGDKRDLFARVRVLLADHDSRTGNLVQGILFSFGFRDIDCVNSGSDVLRRLATRNYDLIITEYSMAEIDGITLVKAIRSAKDNKRIPRDIPIIMLTARAEMDHIQAARDAGISEFVAKPFSAKTISDRIVMVIDNPRSFVDAPGFAGPCRRRRGVPPPGVQERRGARAAKPSVAQAAREAAMLSPPNFVLRDQLGEVSARDILTEMVVAEAQAKLLMAESEFVEWAREDISKLEIAFKTLVDDMGNVFALADLHQCAYRIQSRAGIFGYHLGTEVASLLENYLTAHPRINDNDLLIIRKHIDVVTVIFNQGMKDSGNRIGQELMGSLKKLIAKLG